ncbi:uncharacterized protein BX664DRAFT_339727 [Halteromyces radiatus]|uniref:uncharacterized protein n=1 Tax=Halteromyces radiatus TaxID=101107 RepID=UPI002220F335|nr:uncharacterized protein BX664DRAFT_339727 [Halteromyces radiatus]KAI8083060.1 hypothetical protein BX664DRAFT_339727 [Halteromyces radiatus]
MVSSFTQTIIAILLIPCIPLLIYVIGILIPESHIVSRTITYKTRPERLWELLTDVQSYPLWRPKLESVSIDSITPATLDEGKRVVFVEHSKRDRRTVILHVEQQPLKTMLRVLEERITTAVSLRSPVPTRPHVPTFSGSWTFELKYPNQWLPNNNHNNNNNNMDSTITNETPTTVQLKITEQGVIKKPLVRLSNMLLFGYHRRIDRFMKDLEKRIAQDHRNDSKKSTTTIGENDDHHHQQQQPIKSADNEIYHQTFLSSLPDKEIDLATQDDTLLQVNGPKSTKALEKDWDLVSEIYERQKP